MSRIIAVRKDEGGRIIGVKLDNGQVMSIDRAIQLAKDGAIEGVNVSTSREGKEYLRSNPDGTARNNLDNLPTF